jgi:hypothetical protein
MPKVNPFAQISKRVASLQAKSAKINDELSALAQVVATEMKKLADAPAPVDAKASAKAPVKTSAPKTAAPVPGPKKRGRPAKK